MVGDAPAALENFHLPAGTASCCTPESNSPVRGDTAALSRRSYHPGTVISEAVSMRVNPAAVCLLVACSGGDLTLPDSSDPVTLRIVSGDGQRADAGDLLEQPLVVQVLDSDMTPVPGARIEFSLLGDVPGAAIDPALTTTDAQGRAEAFVRLGTDSGEHLIIARLAGTASPDLSARFSVVALGSGGGGKKDGDGNGNRRDEGGDDDD